MIEQLIANAVLTVLKQCAGYPLAEKSLHNQVNIELDAMACSSADLSTHLQFCKDKGWVKYIVDDFDVKKWFITEAGRVRS